MWYWNWRLPEVIKRLQIWNGWFEKRQGEISYESFLESFWQIYEPDTKRCSGYFRRTEKETHAADNGW